jgi:hypothetical protein
VRARRLRPQPGQDRDPRQLARRRTQAPAATRTPRPKPSTQPEDFFRSKLLDTAT